MKGVSIKNIALIVFGVFTVLYLNSFFGCNKDNSYDIKLAYKDSMFAMKQREIDIKDKEIMAKDSIIAGLLGRANEIMANFDKHQVVYKPIYEQLKNIPVHIDAIRNDDDAIKRAFSKREEN